MSVEYFEANEPAGIENILDPENLDCVLAAGDVSDLGQLQEWLDGLPRSAYGRVFIEVFAPIQQTTLRVPTGVTWLIREKRCRSPRPGIGLPRGHSLACAVDAWLDEVATRRRWTTTHLRLGRSQNQLGDEPLLGEALARNGAPNF